MTSFNNSNKQPNFKSGNINLSTLFNNDNFNYLITDSKRKIDLKATNYNADIKTNQNGEGVCKFNLRETYGVESKQYSSHRKFYLQHTQKERDAARGLLLLAGDIEKNPGPVQVASLQNMSLCVVSSYNHVKSGVYMDFLPQRLKEIFVRSAHELHNTSIFNLSDLFVEKMEIRIELYVKDIEHTWLQKEHNFIKYSEFTKEWFTQVGLARNRMMYENAHSRKYNRTLVTKVRIPCTLNWFMTLKEIASKHKLKNYWFVKNYVPDSYYDYQTDVGEHMRLLLSGDVELNPGPVQSRPLLVRNNDPRTVKLENAIARRDDKIKTLIAHLRRETNRKYAKCQMFGAAKKMDDMNTNLHRICDFLENSLPQIQTNIQAVVLTTVDKTVNIKDDIVLLVIICLVVRMLLVWNYNKTALAVILGFILHFFKFDKQILDLVVELKEKLLKKEVQGMAEDIVYHPYFHTCGKIVFAVMAFICIKQIPGRKDWDNYIARLDRIPRALEGGKKIMDYCAEYFNLATEYVKMMILGKTREELQRANGLYTEIYEWAAEVRKFVDLEQRDKIDTDVTIATQVEALYRRGLKYQADTLLDKEIAKLVAVTLLPARTLYEYVSTSPVRGGGPRMRPVCVWLAGESGVGKTEVVYPLCIDILRAMGLTKPKDFHYQTYGRQVETEFWDGYKGQKIVIYDDAFQMKDDKTVPNPEIFEVIRSCNTFPQHLHMAALHDKNTFSTAEVLLYTTNDVNVKLESITFVDAFYNRMSEHAYKVQPKLSCSIEVPRGSSGTSYRQLDKKKLKPDVAVDLSVYEFQKIVRNLNSDTEWENCGEPISYDEFSKSICNEWKYQKEMSKKKLDWLNEWAARPVVQMCTDDTEEWFDATNTPFGDGKIKLDKSFFVNNISSQIHAGRSLTDIEAEYANTPEVWNAYILFKQSRPTSIWGKYQARIGKVMEECTNYLGGLKNECLRIIQEHPYISMLTVVGLGLSLIGLYREFTREVEKEEGDERDTAFDVDWCPKCVGEEGIWCGDSIGEITRENVEDGLVSGQKYYCQDCCEYWTVGAPVVESKLSGDVKTKMARRVRVELGCSGDVKTNKAKVPRVEGVRKAHIQGCSDRVAEQLILDVLTKNTYQLSYETETATICVGNCTFISGWNFIIPLHYLTCIHARKIPSTTLLRFSQPNRQHVYEVPISFFFSSDEQGKMVLTDRCYQMVSGSRKNGDEEIKDCVMVNGHMIFPPHKNIVKHFVRKADQSLISKQSSLFGAFITHHNKADELIRMYVSVVNIKPHDVPVNIDYPHDGNCYPERSYVQRNCYSYNAPTRVGDCGSVIGVSSRLLQRKLIGMHIAGNQTQEGFACPLTEECISEALHAVNPTTAHISFGVQEKDEIDVSLDPNLPPGKFLPIGVTKNVIGQASKTTLLRSRIYGSLSVPIMAPAKLKPFINEQGEEVDPLMLGLSKCGGGVKMINEDDLAAAANDVSNMVLAKYNPLFNNENFYRILTYEEAVQGTGTDRFMRGVCRTTSGGYPWSLKTKGKPGKTKWMGSEQMYEFDSVDAKELRTSVYELLENCEKGDIGGVYFIDTLKDERRELEKVEKGKTRVFSAGPQHFVIAFRMYFLPFAAWIMNNRIDNEIAVGINPYSVDWDKIARRLKSKGPHMVAGDFSNFDGTLKAQIIWAIFWQIFVPWLEKFNDLTTKEGKQLLNICLGLWTHIAHSVHIFGGNIYMWTHSQPSGNPFTVIINSLYNCIILRMAWINIMKKQNSNLRSMKHFNENVSVVVYGDDNCLNIKQEVVHLFNQQTISESLFELGHVYTDESKAGTTVLSRKLSEVEFLKRRFRYDDVMMRYVAPLRKEVIYEMLNWTRNTVDPDVILMDNIEAAFREIVYHGEDEYNTLRNGINKVALQLPTIPRVLTYQEYKFDAENLSDDMYQF
nr:MAG: putative replicase [Dicistroviridae sp.]